MAYPKLHFIELKNVPIAKQLELEQKLLKEESKNYCIVNSGSPKAIVMGISGKEELLLDEKLVRRDAIPVIRRFSGGGTVIVDEETLFATFIFSKKEIDVVPFPESIMRWTADLYAKTWQIEGFGLKENDYVIFDRKCGGNAQYIRKDRWLHHTSFLWNYRSENMQYLLLPNKRPKYRLDRGHDAFLCTLKQCGKGIDRLIAELKSELMQRFCLAIQT